MAPNDCLHDKKPEVQEGEEPTQESRQPPPLPNIRKCPLSPNNRNCPLSPNNRNCPLSPLSDHWATTKVGPYHALSKKNARLERPNMDHDHQKKPKLSRFYPRDRPSCAMNPTFDVTKYSVPPFPADKSQRNDPKSFPPPEFTGVSQLARKGNEMALCLMDELSLYSANPKPQNLETLKNRKACCINFLQHTGNTILKLLKQQRFLSAELRRVSAILTETVVIHNFCNNLQPLQDLKRLRKEALVLIKKIKVLLRQIREISVTREFVKQSLVAVGSHVSSDEQQIINSQLAELKRLNKSIGRWLF